MVVVAQLVRAPDCGSGGRRFETDLPPIKIRGFRNETLFFGTLFGTKNHFFFDNSYRIWKYFDDVIR